MLSTWNAVSSLDRILDDVMGSALGTATSVRSFDPTIDIRATDREWRFVCDVPGLKSEDIDVTLEQHVLTLKGVRRFEVSEKEHVVLGRGYGEFQRSFQLPDGLAEDQLTAALEDGVLTITIPKLPGAMARKIKVVPGGPKQLTE